MLDIFQSRPRNDAVKMLYEEPLMSLSETYHEASKLNHITGRSFRRRIQSILGPEFFLKIISQAYKTYPTAEAIGLPEQGKLSEPPDAQKLTELIRSRRSVRAFTGQAISIDNLSTLLRNSYGVTGGFELSYGIEQTARAVPSGGALFPLEIYIASFRVEGLAPAIYHYNVIKHSLETVRPGLFENELGPSFYYEDMFKRVSAVVIITGILKRSALKYGERAYRFMMIEAGHVGQNLCLSACSLKLGSVMLGGFMDDEVNEVIGVDGVNETVLYAAGIGCVKQNEAQEFNSDDALDSVRINGDSQNMSGG
jgi:SagB-type dehydrogenase family enzyme